MRNSITITFLGFACVSYAVEQVPTFNLKNKTGQEIIAVVGIQNRVKPTVLMRIKNDDTDWSNDYTYKAGEQIILKANQSVSLYGLNIEELQAIDFYYDLNNEQKRLTAQFVGDYKKIYVKLSMSQKKPWLFAQEGRRNKTTDGYSLSGNIKNQQIKLSWSQNFVPVIQQKMNALQANSVVEQVR